MKKHQEGNKKTRIRILLADSSKMTREGMIKLFNERTDMAIVGESGNGPELVSLARRLKPDIIIMDAILHVQNGLSIIQKIKSENTDVKIIALTSNKEYRSVKEMIRTGASGYLLKNCTFDELAKAIHRVKQGHHYFSREIGEMVVRDYHNHINCQPALSLPGLTPRENEVLELISAGLDFHQIASNLQITSKSVSRYRRNILDKLDLDSIADLTKYAIRKGVASV